MRKILLVGSVIAMSFASQAQAESRMNVRNEGCGEIKSAIRDDGAVLLRWTDPRSGQRRSDRFVSGAPFCKQGFFIKFETINTVSGVCSLKQCSDASRANERVRRQDYNPTHVSTAGGQGGGQGQR